MFLSETIRFLLDSYQTTESIHFESLEENNWQSKKQFFFQSLKENHLSLTDSIK